MNSRTRSIQVLTGKPADRIPNVPLIDLSYAAKTAGISVSKCFLNPDKHAQALVETFHRHRDIDGLSVNLCLDDAIITDISTKTDGYVVSTTGGLTWSIPFDDVGSVRDTQITTFNDSRLDQDDPFSPGINQTLKAIPQNYRERYLINTGVTGPFSQVGFLMGLEAVMFAALEQPAELLAAVEKRLAFALHWIDQLAELDPGCIWIGEGFASGDLISPDLYRRFVLPFEKAVFDRLRQLNIPGILHICGRLGGILEMIPETGCDALELDWPVDIAQAARQIGDRVPLKGNLNTSILADSNAHHIRALAQETIKQAAPARGFILSSGCCLGRDTPPENVDALALAIADIHNAYGNSWQGQIEGPV